jgi:hypothetical protein
MLSPQLLAGPGASCAIFMGPSSESLHNCGHTAISVALQFRAFLAGLIYLAIR